MKYQYLGIATDLYTSGVQAQLNRDILGIAQYCETRNEKLVVCCANDDPLFLLNALGILMVNDVSLAKTWLVYKVKDNSELPDNAEQVIVIPVPEATIPEPNIQTTPANNPYIPREQGQDATHISLIDRPSPNPYAPTSPAGVAVLFGF